MIDRDLGQSGSSATWRTGFKRLAEDVAHGRVGGDRSFNEVPGAQQAPAELRAELPEDGADIQLG